MVITPSEMCLAQQQDGFATGLRAVRSCVVSLDVVMPQGAHSRPGKLHGCSQKQVYAQRACW